MKIVVQRVNSASVEVNKQIVGKIEKGLVALVGIETADTEKEIKKLAEKLANLRIFSDENDKLNLSVKDINGKILAISNFTVCGNASHGHRPSFDNAMKHELAQPLFDMFVKELKTEIPNRVETGIFREDMFVNMQNDGPITIILETK